MYPFLIAIASVLFLLVRNMDRAALEGTTPIIVFLLGVTTFTGLIYSLTYLILKDKYKASLATTLIVIPCLYYVHLTNILQSISKSLNLDIWILVSICLLILTIVIFLLLKHSKILLTLTTYLNVLSILLVVIILSTLIPYLTKSIPKPSPTTEILKLSNISKDIYYIVVDGYGSNNTLKDIYNYNNKDFTDWLEYKDFSINTSAMSNYSTTSLSLASSLNMAYLENLTQTLDKEEDLVVVTQDNKVSRLLKLIGYKYIGFSSGWSPTFHNRYLDLELSKGAFGEFGTEYLMDLVFKPLYETNIQTQQRDRNLSILNGLETLYRIEGPKFILCHIVSPHPPYIFDSNGDQVFSISGWEDKKAYIDQLTYLNTRLKNAISIILEESLETPIIILQSDHGSAFGFEVLPKDKPELRLNPTSNLLKERFSILFATHGIDCPPSPVNLFRKVLNTYYQTNYSILTERHYYNFSEKEIDLRDITNKLK